MNFVLAETFKAIDGSTSTICILCLPGISEQVIISWLVEVFKILVSRLNFKVLNQTKS